jgi:hypothetical protein
MSVPVWSVVKFKIKDGCEDEFLAAQVFEESHMKYMRSFNVIKIDEHEYAHIVEYDDMNATFEVQDQSLDWLESVSHLLEYNGDSRTDAFSGIKVDFD